LYYNIGMFGTKVLEKRISKYNSEIKVMKNLGSGIYIQANGLTQSGGIVESIWNSTIKELRKFRTPELQTVLILGLGAGTVAKLIRKTWPNSKITGVEIDPIMVDLGRKYLDLDKYKVNVKIQDAAKPLNKKFDLVIVDLYLGGNLPKKFTSIQFSRLVYGYVNEGGVAIFNRLLIKKNKSEVLKFEGKLGKIYKKVDVFYPPANIMFISGR